MRERESERLLLIAHCSLLSLLLFARQWDIGHADDNLESLLMVETARQVQRKPLCVSCNQLACFLVQFACAPKLLVSCPPAVRKSVNNL
jgi:hypothetical protein